MKVFDLVGREITTLVNARQKPGTYSVQFNASDLASGIYYYQLNSGNYTETKKFMLLK